MGTPENFRLDIQILKKGKEPIQEGESSQSVSSPKQCMDTLIHDTSFT